MRTVTLSEHESAIVSEEPGDKAFTLSELNSIDRAQQSQHVQAFRWVSRNKIRTSQFVGILASSTARLEVLPKIDGLGRGDTRHMLVRMIATAWDMPISEGELSDHDYQSSDILELLIGLFARKLRSECRAGLFRAYSQRSEDLSRLRGKLNVTRQYTQLAAKPQLLACHYEDFGTNNALNQLILCSVILLSRRALRPDTQRLLSELRTHFSDVLELSASEALSRPISLDRTNNRWASVAMLARRFIEGSYQTAHSGTAAGISLLFDMNLLFETYIAALARTAGTPLGYRVIAQGPRSYLAKGDDSQCAFQTKPDITIQRGSTTVVLDTKWKRLDPTRPNFDVAQADAYQMHGYAHVYASTSVILIYPHHDAFNRVAGHQMSWKFLAGDATLLVATIDLASPHHFVSDLQRLLAG